MKVLFKFSFEEYCRLSTQEVDASWKLGWWELLIIYFCCWSLSLCHYTGCQFPPQHPNLTPSPVIIFCIRIQPFPGTVGYFLMLGANITLFLYAPTSGTIFISLLCALRSFIFNLQWVQHSPVTQHCRRLVGRGESTPLMRKHKAASFAKALTCQ